MRIFLINIFIFSFLSGNVSLHLLQFSIHIRRFQQLQSFKKQTYLSIYNKLRCIFSLVAPFSLKFTSCSLLVVKSLVTRCKICLLLVAEVARCKKSLVTRCKICSLLVAEVARSKKSLITRCKIRLLLVAKNHLLLVVDVARCKKSLVTCCRGCSLQKITHHSL